MNILQTKEEVEDEIKSLSRKRDQSYLDMNKHQGELENLMDKYYELGNTHVKVICISCGGDLYTKNEEGKKVSCRVCGGKGYNWFAKYQEKI